MGRVFQAEGTARAKASMQQRVRKGKRNSERENGRI